MTPFPQRAWSVVKRYDQNHLARIALPLGGIGTGTVSLGGRGDLRDWEIMNRPAKGFTPQHTFFALRAHAEDGRSAPVTRALEGPLDVGAYEGSSGATAANHGLPRFRHCTFPYHNEVMTGFEYTVAIGMLYAAHHEEGIRVIHAIRARYDGRKRNPFNEAECGHHYARAMASWAALLALSGFGYSAVEQSITFAACQQPTRVFWSNGSAWGACLVSRFQAA